MSACVCTATGKSKPTPKKRGCSQACVDELASTCTDKWLALPNTRHGSPRLASPHTRPSLALLCLPNTKPGSAWLSSAAGCLTRQCCSPFLNQVTSELGFNHVPAYFWVLTWVLMPFSALSSLVSVVFAYLQLHSSTCQSHQAQWLVFCMWG